MIVDCGGYVIGAQCVAMIRGFITESGVWLALVLLLMAKVFGTDRLMFVIG